MRETHRIQPTLTEPWLDLPHAKELKAISDLLDQHPMLGVLVAQDISRGKSKRTGGLTGEQVLRAMTSRTPRHTKLSARSVSRTKHRSDRPWPRTSNASRHRRWSRPTASSWRQRFRLGLSGAERSASTARYPRPTFTRQVTHGCSLTASAC